jgi:hypothetical protein
MRSRVIRTAFVLGLAVAASAAARAEESWWDKARDGTVHAAKVTNQAVTHAAKKTDRWLDRAVAKVQTAVKSNEPSPAPRPGPR